MGRHLKAYAEQTYGPSPMGRVIPVGADAKFIGMAGPSPIAPGGSIDILYMGTMGHMHEIDTFVTLARRELPNRIKLRFSSSGVGYNRLISMMKEMGNQARTRFDFGRPVQSDEWSEALKRSPIGLVTLKAGAEDVSMPSKTYSALAAGQAILAVCSGRSDLADLVRDLSCGWVVEPGMIDELQALLMHLAKHPEEIEVKRARALRAGHALYDIDCISSQYIDLFESVLRSSPTGSLQPKALA